MLANVTLYQLQLQDWTGLDRVKPLCLCPKPLIGSRKLAAPSVRIFPGRFVACITNLELIGPRYESQNINLKERWRLKRSWFLRQGYARSTWHTFGLAPTKRNYVKTIPHVQNSSSPRIHFSLNQAPRLGSFSTSSVQLMLSRRPLTLRPRSPHQDRASS